MIDHQPTTCQNSIVSRAPASQATSSRIAGRHHLGISGRIRRNLHATRSTIRSMNCCRPARHLAALSATFLSVRNYDISIGERHVWCVLSVALSLALGAFSATLPVAFVISGAAVATCFYPEEDCTAFAVDAIDRAERQILMNAYALTAGSGIVEALIRAK